MFMCVRRYQENENWYCLFDPVSVNMYVLLLKQMVKAQVQCCTTESG